jgi:hypothetical protein
MKSTRILAVALLSSLTLASVQALASDKDHIAPNFNATNSYSTIVEQNFQQTQSLRQSQSQSNGQIVNTSNYNNPRQTATAGAPPVIVPECSNGGSIGAQRPTFGISLGFSRQDGHCEMLADAAFLASMGMVDTAKSRMCQDEKIAKAFRDSGEWNCVTE